ncbi:unnamed protein product [Owenia fusiformis]|uniref:Uncharacterized protein n=1 Tax=Owenia fusiformis TaxID=6347 RepID=A0A8S4MZJ0_OWEFU|nr:unnamed protein product [Owenia fusiformis]
MAAVLFLIYVPHEKNCKEKNITSSDSDNEDNTQVVANDTQASKEVEIDQADSIKSFEKEGEEENPSQKVEDQLHQPDETASTSAAHDSKTINDVNITKVGERNSTLIDNETHVDFLKFDSPLAEVTKGVLVALSINNDVWTLSNDEKQYQVTFIEDSGERCELILDKLAIYGIGIKTSNSSVSVLPIPIHSESVELDSDTEDTDEDDSELDAPNEQQKNEFKKSIKSRLTVKQVVDGVRSQALLTFDYITLVVIASIIAALGLFEDSSVVLVASMLISPLMGPIMAGTFGHAIGNIKLRNQGLKSEAVGLGICFVLGILIGFIFGLINMNGANSGASAEWPTNEMKSRGMARSLVVGVFIAIASGAGVALSILGGNAGPLVGVAISASLLPPVVNSGMLLAYSVIAAAHPLDTHHSIATPTPRATGLYFNETDNDTNAALPLSPPCSPYVNNAYKPVYMCSMAAETAIMGFISLLLTALNIFFIFLMSYVVLKIKEVAPHTATSATDIFWKKDIKIARDSYKTTKGSDSVDLGRRFLKEWTDMREAQLKQGKTLKGEASKEIAREFRDMYKGIERSETYQGVLSEMAKPPPLARNLSADLPYIDDDVSLDEDSDPHVHFTLSQFPSELSPSTPHTSHPRTVYFEARSYPEANDILSHNHDGLKKRVTWSPEKHLTSLSNESLTSEEKYKTALSMPHKGHKTLRLNIPGNTHAKKKYRFKVTKVAENELVTQGKIKLRKKSHKSSARPGQKSPNVTVVSDKFAVMPVKDPQEPVSRKLRPVAPQDTKTVLDEGRNLEADIIHKMESERLLVSGDEETGFNESDVI